MGKFSAILFFIVVTNSCTQPHNKSGVEAAMHTYDRLIEHMDADSIALLYMPSGELGDVAKGRDSIRNFLKTFKDVHVLANRSSSDSLSIVRDTAYQEGTYVQDVVLASGDTVHLKGTYKARWQWIEGMGWEISRMQTTPVNK